MKPLFMLCGLAIVAAFFIGRTTVAGTALATSAAHVYRVAWGTSS